MTLLADDEFRLFEPALQLDEDALAILLDAAEAAIVDRYGAVGDDVEEVADGGGTYIYLRRRATEIQDIVETSVDVDTTLDEDDFRLRGDGVSLRRLDLGPNSRTYWGAPVAVTYTPVDDTADRKRVQLELVRLDLNYAPGVTSEQIGSWMEQKAANSVWNYEKERAAILDSLIGTQYAPGFA